MTADGGAVPAAAIQPICDPDRRPLLLWAAICASSMLTIDATSLSLALPAIRAELDASLNQIQWVSNAYLLLLSAVMLLGGALGDKLGTARVFRWGIILFCIASFASAFAPDATTLIAARALKGFGGALMIPGSLAIIGRAYPSRERGRAIGIWAAASAIITAFGPIVGGTILSVIGDWVWRIVFLLDVPLGLIGLVLLARGVKNDAPQRDIPLDWAGAILATVSLGALAWGLTLFEISPLSAWGLIIAGFALAAAFILAEARSPFPMVPLNLFKNRTFSATNIATFVFYAALSILMLYLPMVIIAVWGYLPIEAAAGFAPLSICIGALSATVGKWSDRFGPGPLITLGSALVAIGFVLVGITAPYMSFWGLTFPAMFAVGLGMALLVAPLSTAVLAAVPDDMSGVASGVNNAISRVAGLLGIALGTFIVATLYTGPLSFAAESQDATHVASTNHSFMMVCYFAATLAAISAAVSAWGIKRS